MKIQSNEFFNLQVNRNQKMNNTNKMQSTDSAQQKPVFDQILIQSKNTPPCADQFAKEVSNALFTEVRTSASSVKLNDLKKQITEGTYQIDFDEIAKRMMLQ